jgi:hypothetical protein
MIARKERIPAEQESSVFTVYFIALFTSAVPVLSDAAEQPVKSEHSICNGASSDR